MSIPLTLAFTPTSELQVLLNLYNAAFKTVIWEEDEATEGHTWDFVTTDLTDSAFNQTNPCGSSSDQTWQGITCTQASTVCTDESSLTCNILSLDLASFNLTGTIVDDLDYLPFLTKLVLGDNNFFGTIPLTLGNLSDLKVCRCINCSVCMSVSVRVVTVVCLSAYLMYVFVSAGSEAS